MWLYRHDRGWLADQCRDMKVRRGCDPARPRVDWAQRDIRLCEEVRSAEARIRNTPGRPMRVTRTELGRQIGNVALLHRKLDKLPLTAAAIGSVVETRVDFAVRRIRFAMASYHDSGDTVTRAQLIEDAGIRRVVRWSEVAAALDADLASGHEAPYD